MLTTNQKGAVAEAAITKAAVELGVEVYRPAVEGGRYDLVFGVDDQLVRVQCKWASVDGDALVVRCYSSRRARRGLVRRLYTPGEVDAFAVYSAATGRCYFIPFAVVGASPEIRLRFAPTRNNQRKGIRHAKDFEFAATLGRALPGPIAQLGERERGTLEAAGSSPAGSTPEPPAVALDSIRWQS